jgi:hypothetical protein
MRFIVVSMALFLASASLHAVEVSKGNWLASMETALPAAFCNKNMYFRQCFSISAVECEETASSTTRLCLNKYKSDFPEVFDQPRDGTKWGTIIGKCAGTAFEVSLIKKRINSNKCNDANNWK